MGSATVVDPSAPGVEQVRRGLVAYMSAPGYGEMFAEAGFGDVVALRADQAASA